MRLSYDCKFFFEDFTLNSIIGIGRKPIGIILTDAEHEELVYDSIIKRRTDDERAGKISTDEKTKKNPPAAVFLENPFSPIIAGDTPALHTRYNDGGQMRGACDTQSWNVRDAIAADALCTRRKVRGGRRARRAMRVSCDKLAGKNETSKLNSPRRRRHTYTHAEQKKKCV